MEDRKLAFRDTFGQAFIMFAVLNLDFLALFIGALIDGRVFSDLRVWSIKGEAQVSVYLTIFVLWGLGIWYAFRWFKKKNMMDTFSFKTNMKELIGYITAILICIAIPVLLNEQFPEILRAYKKFLKLYGGFYGLFITIQQVIYYLQETFLVAFIIILFQKSGEIMFKKANVPWGAVGLILTWGIIHFVSHPQGAIFTIMEAALYGIFYVISEKKFYPLFLLIFLHFIL